MKFTKYTEYVCNDGNTTIIIRFEPVTNIISFSHKVHVFIDGKRIAVDWLGSDFHVAEKHALYYYEKHKHKIV